MKPSIKSTAQGGFTLIELIVVIVILGILAATALPKFASLGGDARLASLNAARGALNATAAMAHGKWLANPSGGTSITVEDVSVTLNANNGYPSPLATTAQAAGLSADYTAYPTGATGTNVPSVPADSLVIVPNSIVGTTSATKCYVTYTSANTANTVPTVAVTGNATDCN